MSEHDHSTEHHEFKEAIERQNKILAAISRCCDVSPAKHDSRLDRATAVHSLHTKLVAAGISFRLSDRGWTVAEKNGTTVGLQELVQDLLLTDPELRDAASVQSAVTAGYLQVQAKSDLGTAAEKTAYIGKMGYAAFAALPLKREAQIDLNPATMTCRDWNRLSVSQKVQLQSAINRAANGNLRVAEKMLGEIIRRA